MSSLSVRLGISVLLLLTACGFKPPTVSASRYKLSVSSEGLYRVATADLRNAGIDPRRIDPTTLQLFHDDREAAIRVQGDPQGDFAFEFYAPPNDSSYSPSSAYWFQWGIAKGKRMQEVALPSPAGIPKESFADTVDLSKPSLYIPEPGDPGTSWFWQSLTAPATTTVTATLASSLPAAAQLRVNLWGGTTAPVSPNHHVTVFVNNTRVADEKWSGQGPHPIDATIPAAAVRPGENAIRLVAPGDTGAPADIVLLRSVQVTYQRRLVLDSNRNPLKFGTSGGTYRLGGFAGDQADLYDITNAGEPTRAANVSVSGGAIIFNSNAESPHLWIAADPMAYKAPARIVPMITSDLRSTARHADYIIITYPDFVDALKPLVQWRGQQGLKVSVVTTDEIYNEFGFGNESPLAIRAFVDYAYRQWARPAPRYVLLVGKASYDYLDYLKGANKNLVPTFLVDTPNLGQAASDNWFVAPDDASGHPVMAIGRIPAKTTDQVGRAVSKTIAFESANAVDWKRRAIFVADDKESTFNSMSDGLAAKMPGMQVQKVYLSAHQGDVNSTRAEIIQQWNAGASIVSYVGHGSIDTWAAGPLFSAENLGDLKNGDRLPILFTPTCLDGFFYHPQKDSLAEDLLFKNDGGIVAGLVPTGLSFPQSQEELMSALFDELFQNPESTLGQAILRAKQKMPSDSPDAREVIDTFGLLGDPALRVGSGK